MIYLPLFERLVCVDLLSWILCPFLVCLMCLCSKSISHFVVHYGCVWLCRKEVSCVMSFFFSAAASRPCFVAKDASYLWTCEILMENRFEFVGVNLLTVLF